MGIFSPNPEKLARSITEAKLGNRRRARLFQKLLALPPNVQWLRAMMIVAMKGYLGEDKPAVQVIAQILTGEERINALFDIAKHADYYAYATAMEALRRGPIGDSVVDGFCEIILGTYGEGRQLVAADELYWLTIDDERIRAKYVSALAKVMCEGSWYRGEGSFANGMFRRITRVPQVTLEALVIPELVRRIIAAPLSYESRVGHAAPEQVLYFLQELQKICPEGVRHGFEAIEEATIKLQIAALSETTQVALRGQRFEQVEGAVEVLRKLSKRGVVGASKALKAFEMAPARKLPRRVLHPYDYWDAGEQFTSYRASDDLVSTANLGQKEP